MDTEYKWFEIRDNNGLLDWDMGLYVAPLDLTIYHLKLSKNDVDYLNEVYLDLYQTGDREADIHMLKSLYNMDRETVRKMILPSPVKVPQCIADFLDEYQDLEGESIQSVLQNFVENDFYHEYYKVAVSKFPDEWDRLIAKAVMYGYEREPIWTLVAQDGCYLSAMLSDKVGRFNFNTSSTDNCFKFALKAEADNLLAVIKNQYPNSCWRVVSI